MSSSNYIQYTILTISLLFLVSLIFDVLLFFFTFTQYQDQREIVNVECKTCVPNTYQADDKKAAVNHDSEEDCLDCPDNMFSEAGKQGCTPCAAGKAANDTTKSTGICVDCVAGQVSSSKTELKCEKCEVGFYQKNPGLPSCSKCVPGRYQDDTGAKVCKRCAPGRHDTTHHEKFRKTETVCKK